MKSNWILKITAAILFSVVASPVSATNIVINIVDGAGEGFNDPTPTIPVTGNPGTTLGQQRLNVFLAAADFWEARLDSDVDIIVDAQFDPLTCTAFSALLGFAGPLGAVVNFPNAPQPNQIYPIALGNSLAGVDLDTAGSDIFATFNSNLNGSPACLSGTSWNYEIGVSTGSPFELFATVLHELAHGLGFLSFHDLATGAKLAGLDDSFIVHLADQSTGLAWPAMTNAQRLASSTNTGNLVWTGAQVAAGSGVLTSGLQPSGVQMYAPNPLEPGSSVSHFDTALIPDELMEPLSTANPISTLSTGLMYDIGWIEPVPVLECNGLIVTVDLAAGDAPTSGDDVILGTSGIDVIAALGGNDTICGEDGDDFINAGPGDDWVDGGDGDDDVFGVGGEDTLLGGPGADLIVSGAGADIIEGNDGDDVLNGGPDDDLIMGGDGADELFGQGGADNLFGGSGDDFLLGLDGDDMMEGNDGNDTINGGPGNDTLNGSAGNDTIFGLAGDDIIDGGADDDLLIGQLGDDNIVGGDGNDTMVGNEGNDTMQGISGDNLINGGPDDDSLFGGTGNDMIFGDGNLMQAGNDTIDGGPGTDLLAGFAGADTITSTDGEIDTVNGGPDDDVCNTESIDTVFNCP